MGPRGPSTGARFRNLYRRRAGRYDLTANLYLLPGRDLAERRPWESVSAHLAECELTASYFGYVYLAAGRRAPVRARGRPREWAENR